MAAGRGVRLHWGCAKFFDDAIDELIAHAEHGFELLRPAESGGTVRDEYLSTQRQKGGGWVHPGLIPPPCPDGLEYLLHWFGELSAVRQSGFGIGPISYSEIRHWADLTARAPSPIEVHALRRLDTSFIRIMSRKDG